MFCATEVFVLCGCVGRVSATGRRSFVLPRLSCGAGLRLCHWSRALGLCPWGLPPVSVLRPVTRYARGAWGCVRCSTGRFGQRDSSSAGARRSVWRATRRAAFCRHTGFVDCGRVFFRRQIRVFRPVCTAFAPALCRPYGSFALAHCESCTAPRRVAVELKASRHDSASISKVLKSCCGPRVEGSTTGGAVTQAGPPQCAVAAHKCAPP